MEDTLTKYFLGELTQSEISDLFYRLETDETLKAEFVRMQNIYALSHLSHLSANEAEGKIGWQKFIREIKTRKQQKTIRLAFQYAAIGLALIASTFFATNYFHKKLNGGNEMNTLYVPAGQRAQLTLQDGTEVWLNAQSTLKYPSHFSRKNREVEIIGEAFFDVAEDTKRPFIVSTQNIEMKVLGTQFNVYSYSEAGYIQTDLVEGSLMVYGKKTPQTNYMLKPYEQITIKDEQITIGQIESVDHFLWKEGIYTFHNERLLDIIEKLQLYYDVKIIVEDPGIFNVRYTGKFRQRDGIDEILKIIQKIQKFNIEKDIERNIITLTK